MIIQLKDVGKSYPQANFKLEHLTFSVKKGDRLGLIGQNGTGKSTILKMMNGLVEPDYGQIFYHGQELETLSPEQIRDMRKSVAYIFQQGNLLEGETVLYHLKLVYLLAKKKPNRQTIDDTLAFMALSHLKNVPCRDLSGGQKQKVAIAMAILQEPQVLLCDEISSALDANSEQEIFDLLKKLRETSDIAIVMISHNLSLLKQFCDEVMILDKGRLVDTVRPVKHATDDPNKHYLTHVKEFLTHVK
ncbi:ATP-binding cassette domain-containing protein [Streptococcus entericus]|uniref:ATP-binding cassette domain-containing protein n=1 Tax=Streptococcus entericus TaxID=155680 RepID=UPI00037211E4|nr:ATP-binding cassette domain-containing protein [Streptococcus entericus]